MRETTDVRISRELFDFLTGAGPLNGCWFGDRHPDEKGAFWWRKELQKCAALEPAPKPAGGEWVTDDLVERVAIERHHRYDDEDTVKWGKQPSRYRTSARKTAREVLTSLAAVRPAGPPTPADSAQRTLSNLTSPEAPQASEVVREAVKFLGWVAKSYEAHAKCTDDPEELDAYHGSAEMAREHAAALASLSAKVAEVERERDREGLRAEEQWAGWVKADVAKRNAEARAERLEKALRIIGHTGNRGIGIALGAPAIDNKFQTDGEVARAALQQEGESDE